MQGGRCVDTGNLKNAFGLTELNTTTLNSKLLLSKQPLALHLNVLLDFALRKTIALFHSAAMLGKNTTESFGNLIYWSNSR